MELNNFYQTATVCGTVINLDLDTLSFCVQSRSSDTFDTYVGSTTYYEVLTNIDGLWRDRVAEPDGLNRVAIDEGIGRLCDLLEDELDALQASTRQAER